MPDRGAFTRSRTMTTSSDLHDPGWDRRLRYPTEGVRWPDSSFHDCALATEEARASGRYAGPRPNLVRYTAATGGSGLVTAPHAVTHWRGELRKPADVGTGFLAEALAEATGWGTLIAEGEQGRDGNFDPGSLFQQQLRSLLREPPAGWTGSSRPRYVLDLHGMSDGYGPDVCLGTGRNSVLSRVLHDAVAAPLRAAGFEVSVDDPYDAASNPTVTRACHEMGVPALQVEIARRVRRVLDDPEPALLLVQVLADALGALPVNVASTLP